jgi:hypothetical protein
VSLGVHHFSGAPARFCVWEEPRDACAEGSGTISIANGWQRLTTEVTPDAGTRRMLLFLYSDAAPGAITRNDYAGISASEVIGGQWAAVFVAHGAVPAGERLIQSPNGVNASWTGPAGDRRVVVDGLRNGWLGRGAGTAVAYGPAGKVHAAYLVTLLGVAVLLGLVAAGPVLARWRRRPVARGRRAAAAE